MKTERATLTDVAGTIALRAAYAYAAKAGRELDTGRLTAELRARLPEAVAAGLADAKAAIEARMPEAAEQTFAATVALAGIAAAKAVLEAP